MTDLVLHMSHPASNAGEVARNAAHVESLAVDGLVTHVADSWRLMDEAWVGNPASVGRQLREVADAFTRPMDLWLLVVTRDPGDLFDDEAWSRVVQNWQTVAREAREAGFTGIQFDNEEYFEHWDDFPEDYGRGAKRRGLDAYREQASERGREIAEAIADVWPDAKLSVAHGPYLSVAHRADTPDAIPAQAGGAGAYELLGPFFTGLAEGAGPRMTVIDGGELYALRGRDAFEESVAYRSEVVPERIDWTVSPDLLRAWDDRIEFGHMVYSGEFPDGATQSPRSLTRTLDHALAASEDTVFLYSDPATVDWYDPGVAKRWLRALDAVERPAAGTGGLDSETPVEVRFDAEVRRTKLIFEDVVDADGRHARIEVLALSDGSAAAPAKTLVIGEGTSKKAIRFDGEAFDRLVVTSLEDDVAGRVVPVDAGALLL